MKNLHLSVDVNIFDALPQVNGIPLQPRDVVRGFPNNVGEVPAILAKCLRVDVP
jgi:hypothetical protein